MSQTMETPLAADLLVTATTIAAYLKWDERRVRHIAEMVGKGKSSIPIWSEPGVGICAMRSQLDAYFATRSQTIASSVTDR